ncbi:MAG TPA: lipase maturation factor family protein [Polyangiaceae bacterium]|nr:lipase maturation factor family protein [Polyangiaceae bacterium]
MLKPGGWGTVFAQADTGSRAVRLFQCLLSLVFLDAWLSLASQIGVLIGHRGLLPIAPLVEHLQQRDIGFSEFPSLLLFGASDGALHTLVNWGVVLSVLSLLGIYPRLVFAINTLLYLSATVAGQNFLTFQWDNLLLECGLLAALLSPSGRQRWVPFLFRILLFKLYFESGIAKYQSHIGDWQDGSAMTFYYETAPIPTRLAWFMHHAPAWWHQFESWLTLAWEIGVPFLIFGPLLARRFAFVVFTAFQLINFLTANYGFFCVLALVLQVFLLDERDLFTARRGADRILSRLRLLARWRRVRAWHRWGLQRLARPASWLWKTLAIPRRAWSACASVGASLIVCTYLALSLQGAVGAFWRSALPREGFLASLQQLYAPYRLVNTYHLFAAITRSRIEPEFQVMTDTEFVPLTMHYKPGPLDRAPPFVAPHQPRVDFLLWFYGLSYRRGTPAYVNMLLRRLCEGPQAVQPLFVDALPPDPRAVRIEFFRYHFTTADERALSGNWWTRAALNTPITVSCPAER